MLTGSRVIVSREVYQQFVDKLDMPPQTNEALRKTTLPQSPWERLSQTFSSQTGSVASQ